MAIGSHYNHWDLMTKNIGILSDMASKNNIAGIYQKLQEIIPEYIPDAEMIRHYQKSSLNLIQSN